MKITDYDKLTDLKWLNLFNVHFKDENSRGHSWQIASRHEVPHCLSKDMDAPDAVVIAPFHRSRGRLVVVREFRLPLADDELGFPAGLVDPGETPEEAARREMKEETGLDLTQIIEISPPLYSSSGMTDESVAMVYAYCDGVPSTQGAVGTERIEVLFLTPQDAANLMGDASVKFDVKTWLVLAAFAQRHFLP